MAATLYFFLRIAIYTGLAIITINFIYKLTERKLLRFSIWFDCMLSSTAALSTNLIQTFHRIRSLVYSKN